MHRSREGTKRRTRDSTYPRDVYQWRAARTVPTSIASDVWSPPDVQDLLYSVSVELLGICSFEFGGGTAGERVSFSVGREDSKSSKSSG